MNKTNLGEFKFEPIKFLTSAFRPGGMDIPAFMTAPWRQGGLNIPTLWDDEPGEISVVEKRIIEKARVEARKQKQGEGMPIPLRPKTWLPYRSPKWTTVLWTTPRGKMVTMIGGFAILGLIIWGIAKKK